MIRTRLRSAGEQAAATARSWAAEPKRLHRASTVLAVAVLIWSLVLSGTAQPGTVGTGLALVAPFVAVAVLLMPGHRQLLMALCAAVMAQSVPASLELAPGAAALVFLALVDSTVRVAWFTGVAALTGSVLGVGWYSSQETPAAFVATVFGGVCGSLVRSTGQAGRLQQEAQRLRTRSRATEQQARWLEQRTGLARELHDVVGHHVTAMVVQAEAGQVGDPRVALREIGALGRTALGELDALVVALRDPDAELMMSAPPRLADIDELLAGPLRHQGLDVVVRVDPEPGLDEVGVLTVYRIAQEALTNVARHAQARNASVEVRRVGEHVRLRVTDDGIGPPDQPDRWSGLLGIHERVAALGGVWELGQRLGGGTIVDVLLWATPASAPLPTTPASAPTVPLRVGPFSSAPSTSAP